MKKVMKTPTIICYIDDAFEVESIEFDSLFFPAFLMSKEKKEHVASVNLDEMSVKLIEMDDDWEEIGKRTIQWDEMSNELKDNVLDIIKLHEKVKAS